MRKFLWILLSVLNLLAAIGFLIAYRISGYPAYIPIAVLWILIGCLTGMLGILRKKKSPKSEEQNRLQKDN